MVIFIHHDVHSLNNKVSLFISCIIYITVYLMDILSFLWHKKNKVDECLGTSYK
jgi:hypothetical protein